jgi:hypothetical protein
MLNKLQNASINLSRMSTINPNNISTIRNRGIKVIHNVYQSKYKFGIASTGLGDFIRGSYFILEFCNLYNFKPKIIFNNSISKFLKIKTSNLHIFNSILKQILSFPNVNFKQFVISNDNTILEPLKDTGRIMTDFMDYLSFIPIYNNNVFVYCISYPFHNISLRSKIYMRKILEPSNEMKMIVNKKINELELKYKEFSVIHIRSGDKYLNQNNSIFKKNYINQLISSIKNVMSVEKKFLLISDNNQIKKIIIDLFPSVKTFYSNITHFGEGVVLEDEKVKNTLIDFYLLSFSKEIFSFSSYKHGSGFSYWCAQTYNIPYICKFIE